MGRRDQYPLPRQRLAAVYVVIIGAGEVGLHIAGILSQEGQKVALIERDPERLAKATEEVDALTVAGNGASRRVLLEANVRQADILIAVTDSDEVNMIACMAAKRVGVPLTVARIRNPDYLDSGEAISSEFTGIDYVIQPEAAVAEEIGKLADCPGALEVESFSGGQARMLEVEIAVGSPCARKAIADMSLPRQVVVTGVLSGDTISVPRGGTVLNPGDRVFLAGQPAAVTEAAAMMSLQTKAVKAAMVLGCNDVGIRVAMTLEARDIRLTVFEKDPARSAKAASLLNSALVLRDEGLEERTLIAEGIKDVDLFVAATGDDRLNILASLQAKRLGAARTIAVLERAEFSEILRTAGVDVAISPRRLTASAVLRLVRAGRVLNAAVLDKSAGEVLEFLVAENSPVVGVPLRDTRFPAGAVVGVLKRKEGVEVARGDTIPAVGDIAIVFAATDAIAAVEKLFTPRRFRLRR
jgi:trk/ktr system potassium uptake protein